MINWWQTSFGQEELDHLTKSFWNQNISQGKVTQEFEIELSRYLGVKHVIATSSGSTALMLSLLAIGLKPGDEVIVPNRTWIATAHAAHLLGAKVVLVDVEADRPIIDVSQIESLINDKTKVLMPVHMNGRAANMKSLKSLAEKYQLKVIEDAAQAIGSRNDQGFLGTQSDIGCFSLSVAKTIATGQGGFAVTNSDEIAFNLKAIRTHGVENVKDPNQWGFAGFNFRFTDILASIGIEQLKKLPARIEYLKEIYMAYEKGLAGLPITQISVNLERGEAPVYIEYLVENRDEFIKKLKENGIDSRPFYPDLDKAKYFSQGDREFPNSRRYGKKGIYLPCGPSQSMENVTKVIKVIREIYA